MISDIFKYTTERQQALIETLQILLEAHLKTNVFQADVLIDSFKKKLNVLHGLVGIDINVRVHGDSQHNFPSLLTCLDYG